MNRPGLQGSKWAATPSGQLDGAWYAVQLHAHSTHSDGAYTVKQLIAMAREEGLDALGISDHDTTAQWLDPDLIAERDLVMLRSEEARDDRKLNHMGLHGMTGLAPIVRQPRERALQEATERGGTIIVNHPANRFFPWWPMVGDPRVHAVEVWNGWFWNPLVASSGGASVHAPAAVPEIGFQLTPVTENDAESDAEITPPSMNEKAIAWWADLVSQGQHVAPIAAADFHRRPQNLASPCTLVWAKEKTEAAILEGIRAGRALLVMHPRKERLELYADPGGTGRFDALPGDTAPAASRFRLRVQNATGETVRVMVGKNEVLRLRVPMNDWQHDMALPRDTFPVSASERPFVYARLDTPVLGQMHAMTGAIYLQWQGR